MMNNLQTLSDVLFLSHGKTIGGEPMFMFPEVLDALNLCTKYGIAVLGIELFSANCDKYYTEGISTYDIQLQSQSWQEFVLQNNNLAIDFVKRIHGGDDHFYLLTPCSESEYSGLKGT